MEISKLLSKYESVIGKLLLSEHQRQVLSDIKNCRTGHFGAHLYICQKCGTTHLLNNSCRNRNCPVCQGNKRRKWVEKQCSDLLNIPYYHVVFTVPEILNPLFLFRPKILYSILFSSVWQTIKIFFKDEKFFGGKGGMLSVLHTWGQTLVLHPHLHCIIPGAGIDKNGNFAIIKGKDKYLFPVKALGKVFRAKFAAELTRQAKIHTFVIPQGIRCLMFTKNWVVFCKRPFANPQAVVAYLGRYTYRSAISESRILSENEGTITFSYKDYRNNGVKATMDLPVGEFFRRYALHILPKKFIKIRHYGILSNSSRKAFVVKGALSVGKFENKPATISNETGDTQNISEIAGSKQIRCPACKTGTLTKIASINYLDYSREFQIINENTGEILLHHSRAGPQGDLVTLLVSI